MDSQSPVPPPPVPFRESRSRRLSALATGVILLFYAGFFRWAFAEPGMADAGGLVSLSFICSVPFACGAISVAIARWTGRDRWFIPAIGAPCFVLLLGLGFSILFKIEAAICVVMAAPLLLAAAILGGLLAHALLPRNAKDCRLHLTFAVFLPFIAAYVEGSLHWPTETKAIENTILIQAPAERIWPEIASVSAIAPEQIENRWIYHIGFPKPIAATLDRQGVGGIRTATFERGVSFYETVTEWDSPRKLAFTIHADPDFIPRTAFDQHIIVGGRFYDVLDGIYAIEPLSPTTCRLHLTSHHRLTTRFNAYAGWWSEKIMDQIQGSILQVIRKRAEEAAR